jgi:hypothetical protein
MNYEVISGITSQHGFDWIKKEIILLHNTEAKTIQKFDYH